jgi:hypothetical protein
MSKSRLLASVALAALCLPVAALSPAMPLGASAAQAQSVNVSFQLFFDQLQPHGVWVQSAKYNYVFCPTGVDASWRPYTRGHWLYMKDRGWYFASDEPFAWATYHYGRWFADQRLGWCWVPGTKWAPAWVSWRRSDNVVGWAPLPPEGDGYAVAVAVSRRELPEPYWVFVPTERFVEPDLSVNIVIGSQQPDYYAQTQFLGPVTVEGDVVINNVIDVTYIEQTTNQQVIIYQPQAAADPATQTVDADAKAITIFDQDVAEPAAEAAPPEPVEETDAATTIETKGGTAGATADLPDEAGAATEAPAPDASAESPKPAASQETPAPEAEQPAEQKPAPSKDAVAPSDGNNEAAPAAEAPAETNAPAAADQPAAGPSEQPAQTKPADCAPDAMVDGKCPPAADQPAAQPDANAQTSEQTAPESDAAPAPADAAPDATLAPETAAPEKPAPEAAPSPDDEAPPSDGPAAQEEGSPAASDSAPTCLPEAMVDGKCPAVPAEPAQK